MIHLQALSIEVIVTLAAIIMLGMEAFGVKNRRLLAYFGCAACVVAGVVGFTVEWPIANAVIDNHKGFPPLFGGAYVVDISSIYLKELMVTLCAIALLISVDYVGEELSRPGEYYTMFMFVCLGMLFLASANDLITIFIGIEMASMPMYVLSACLKYNQRSSEAGLKFFILGALASAFYLLGASLTMGTLGTIYVNEFPQAIMKLQQPPQALYIGLLCIIGAIAFKIAAAPFHMWAPDVYQGAPTPTTAFLSTGPKVAGVAVLMRILFTGFNVARPEMGINIKQDWVLIISVLSLLSMTVGNLVAMHQTNIKRMMAFSGVSHMGYILLGLAAGSQRGLQGVMFYLYIYTLTTLAAWAVVIVVTLHNGSEEIKDMAGLSRRSPYMAFVLMLALLSLGGLPPLSGFVGKFYLFTAAWDSGLSWLVLAGILNSVASLFYYFGALKGVYWEAGPTDEPISVPFPSQIAMAIGVFAIVVMALFTPLLSRAGEVAKALYGS